MLAEPLVDWAGRARLLGLWGWGNRSEGVNLIRRLARFVPRSLADTASFYAPGAPCWRRRARCARELTWLPHVAVSCHTLLLFLERS